MVESEGTAVGDALVGAGVGTSAVPPVCIRLDDESVVEEAGMARYNALLGHWVQHGSVTSRAHT